MVKFLSYCARIPELDVGRFMDNLASELTKLFLVRVANASLALNLRSVQIERSFTRRLASSHEAERLSEVREEMARFEIDLPLDPRLRMHGHDLVDLRYWFSHESPGSPAFRTKDNLETALLMAVDVNDLLQKRQLENILSWAEAVSTNDCI